MKSARVCSLVVLPALLLVIALCADGAEVRGGSGQDPRCPKKCTVVNIQAVCGAEVHGDRARLRTFSTECELRKYNCERGTHYVFLFNGGCPSEGRP